MGGDINVNNPLNDKEFLRQLNESHLKEQFIKIIALDINENPIEAIEGHVTGGSITIDGTSSVRRSCSISMVAKDLSIHDFYWGVATKIKIYIGLKNEINSNYDDIIWFKQGIFVLTSFSTSASTNNFAINLTAKDKMCLLNGEISGQLPASIDFGTLQEDSYDYIEKIFTDYKKEYTARTFYIYNKNTQNYELDISEDGYNENNIYYTRKIYTKFTQLPIKQIIKEAIHTYGHEPYHNIIINDVEDYGLELLDYRGETPIYFLYDELNGDYTNILLDDETPCYIIDQNKKDIALSIGENTSITTLQKREQLINISKENIITNIIYNNTLTSFNNDRNFILLKNGNSATIYSVVKISKNDTAGYRITDLTYPGELITNIGDTLTTMLDKIKNTFVSFEYYYDIDGRFIFQKKKTYIQTNWNNLTQIDNDIYALPTTETSATVYNFENSNLITAIQNTPQIGNIKNDFSVWGQISDKVLLHMRYALDKKPSVYTTYDGITYYTQDQESGEKELLERVRKEIIQRLLSYIPEHELPEGLEKPTQKDNGEWTPGWWNILDWHQYYIKLTGKDPVDLMKRYATNYNNNPIEPLGYTYVDLDSIFPTHDNGVNNKWGSNGQWKRKKIWLFNISADNRLITYHNSQFGQNAPFSGCGHSYTYFETNSDAVGGQGYFYNPSFPTGVYENQIQEEFEELKKKHKYGNDWREIIYIMAKDYYKYGQRDDFLGVINKNNTVVTAKETITRYPEGKTGYEQYYDDIISWWRSLYNPEAKIEYEYIDGKYDKEGQWRPPIIKADSEYCDYFTDITNPNCYWNTNVVEAPEKLLFWFDFLDTNAEIDKYSVKAIGTRSKTINDKDISAIYFREVGNIIFTSEDEFQAQEIKTGYTYIFLTSQLWNLFNISRRNKSAKDMVDDLMYNYLFSMDSITLTTLPIYYLEPNTRIFVQYDDNQIYGDYIISRLSIPLTYNGTMSITATKVANRLY